MQKYVYTFAVGVERNRKITVQAYDDHAANRAAWGLLDRRAEKAGREPPVGWDLSLIKKEPIRYLKGTHLEAYEEDLVTAFIATFHAVADDMDAAFRQEKKSGASLNVWVHAIVDYVSTYGKLSPEALAAWDDKASGCYDKIIRVGKDALRGYVG